ncbi:Rha family transcriptional regulator [Pseudomonas sp. P867]|uniref:Rha family transcriptional regulator n=1 Tax=Pseudomonas sp. P867 TaxID=2816050 RepID=UPI001CA73800|nr:Rha family transcriptional regulator [Pseudomonas sp. P867]MBY8970806.1 Rha family transcriptional regulator [Pseudomonas sp. P867]
MNTIMVTQIGGEPRVDSRQLAKQLGTKHTNPMALIERYLAKFEEFGVVPFQTEKPLAGTAGGRPERFALLNEDQAFFLLSLSRNTNRVVELKASLIMAFREVRYGHACQTLEARKKDASTSGRRLAHWRYDNPGVYAHVAHLREQLRLPLDSEDFRPCQLCS